MEGLGHHFMYHSQHLGWIAVLLFLCAVSVYIARCSKSRSRKAKAFRGRHHQWWGSAAIIVGLLHGIQACHFQFSWLGLLLWLVMAALAVVYILRKQLKKKWLSVHKILSVAALILLILHIATSC